MRQSSLIAALAVLLLLAAVAAWFFVKPGRAVTVNSADDVALANSQPPAHTPEDKPGLPISDPQPEPPREADPTSPEPITDDQWQIRGRIALTPELAKLIRSGDEWASSVQVYYLADGSEPENAVACYIEPDEKLAFSDLVGRDTFNLEEGAPLPPGRWQVLYGFENETPPTLFDLGDVEFATLKGVVTPTITGRIIDFGTVTVGVDEYFYRNVTLTGRLVHSGGRALSYSGQHYLYGRFDDDEDSWEIPSEFHTQCDGMFTAIAWLDHPDDPANLERYQWAFLFSDEVEWQGADPNRKELAPPKWDGRKADFGDITLTGALLEIVLKGEFKPKVDDKGNLIIDRWGGYEGDCAELELHGGIYFIARAFPHPHTTVTVLPEGRYTWNAWPTTNGLFAHLNGVLLLREGQEYRLELDFTPLPSIPLVVTPLDGKLDIEQCSVIWEVMRGDTEIAAGVFDYDADARVPVVEGCETRVSVSAAGFKAADATARPGMDKLEIALEADDRPSATLIVVVPASPEGLDKKTTTTLRVQVGNLQHTEDRALDDKSTEARVTLHGFGAGTVTLLGGKAWGYPGGILSGPVEFEIAAGETRRVELPPIDAPPWPKPIKRIEVQATTSGCPMTLDTFLRYKDAPQPARDSLRDGGSISVRGLPVAVTDGREDYPVQFAVEENGRAKLAIDFPHTIEVRLTRAGQPVKDFQVSAATIDVNAPDLFVECNAVAIDGVAKLWIPRGRVRLDVRMGGTVASEKVEVTPGQVLQLDVASALLDLTLEIPEGSYDPDAQRSEAPELWTLQQFKEEGGWLDYAGVSFTTSLLLEPGRYRAAPWNGGSAVEITLDGDKTVILPEIAAPNFGSMILKYDVAKFGDAYVDGSFAYELVSKIRQDDRYYDGKWSVMTLVPDGIKLSGLPMDTDIAIWGSLWVEEGEDGHELLLRPLKVRITKDGQQVEAVIRRGVSLDDEWFDIDARWVTPVENLLQPSEGQALPGRHEIAIFDNNKLQFREWITIPETSIEPFKIPEGLRRELETRELIEPKVESD